jgi:hypothetical protein
MRSEKVRDLTYQPKTVILAPTIGNWAEGKLQTASG